ncbi:hypothetical protein CDD80_606 [Ophiocordyceps camponoti-rufipedis]|uniref:SMP-30/Gluconolactonase/LRE-like region domain-containing protein n=1 Tax=Ophiocordyceps camponoti-rufipedis TaxID=2004952 RepID=A0A2C5Z8T7_9HYPO|nr:hypothetical protein CDD80_606 [Ophiocordyceps camponoti-rufipedis]
MRTSASGLWSVACGLLSLVGPAAGAYPSARTLPRRTVAQFPPGTWIENIAVRSNGNLLLTSLLPNASVYEVSDPSSDKPKVTRHFTIQDASGLLGIAEIAPDVYAIAGGNVSASGMSQKGSFRVWTFDFAASPKPKLVQTIPDAVLLNGVTTLPNKDKVILISDSGLGQVWRVDIPAGKLHVAVKVPEMGSSKQPRPIGVNGIHIRDGALTWTNHDTLKMWTVAITADGNVAPGAKPKEDLTFPATALDDFIWGPGKEKTAWVTTNADNRVFAVSQTGSPVVVAGAKDSINVSTATACQFGRTGRDSKILYVSTGGDGIKGGHGGKVEALDTSGFRF